MATNGWEKKLHRKLITEPYEPTGLVFVLSMTDDEGYPLKHINARIMSVKGGGLIKFD